MDLGGIRTLTSVVTNTRSDYGQWVSSYTLTYSYDSVMWHNVTDSDGHTLVFDGNTQYNVAHENEFEVLLTARYVALHPKSWYKHIVLRWGLFGCPYGKMRLYYTW